MDPNSPTGDGDKKIFGGPGSGQAQSYYGVHGRSPEDYWIVGSNGAIWHYTGRGPKWISVASTLKVVSRKITKQQQRGAACGILPPAQFKGATWRAVYDAGAKRSVWVVGDGGKILRHDWGQSQLVAVPLPSLGAVAPDLRTVWVDPQQNVAYIGGTQGHIWCG